MHFLYGPPIRQGIAQTRVHRVTGCRYAELAAARGGGGAVGLVRVGVDATAAAHVCGAPLGALTPVAVADLRVGVNAGVALRLTTVAAAYARARAPAAVPYGRPIRRAPRCRCRRYKSPGGVALLAADDRGVLVSLQVYNGLPFDAGAAAADRAFPRGTGLWVSEPYYKLFNSGTLGLRVDNPCNVRVDVGAPPPGADACGGWRLRGNDLFRAGRCAIRMSHAGRALTHAYPHWTYAFPVWRPIGHMHIPIRAPRCAYPVWPAHCTLMVRPIGHMHFPYGAPLDISISRIVRPSDVRTLPCAPGTRTRWSATRARSPPPRMRRRPRRRSRRCC